MMVKTKTLKAGRGEGMSGSGGERMGGLTGKRKGGTEGKKLRGIVAEEPQKKKKGHQKQVSPPPDKLRERGTITLPIRHGERKRADITTGGEELKRMFGLKASCET